MRPILLSTILVALHAAAASGQDRYVLTAELDPNTHVVRGSATISWHNRAAVATTELWLHLYLNAFASDQTVFMRESRGALRGVRSQGRGGIEVHALRVEGGPDLLARADSELIEGDRTQMRVPLPTPIAPGGSLSLEVTFTSTLPPVFARSGYAGSFHMVAQWFPKLAVLERDGTWRSFPYHGNGEFYADFAHYDLTVTTPGAFAVGATGQMVEEHRRGGAVTRRFIADDVHDTAFCAWDHFEEQTLDVDGVSVRVLHPPGYDDAVRVHAQTTADGLRHFGALFGPYPYPTLTVVVPPRGADGAAGMEYPMLFLTAGSWYVLDGVYVTGELVTAHELAHQWFQGMVASDEVRWPMLDEGITQWATGELLRHRHGERRSAADVFGARLDVFQLMRSLSFPRDAPANTPPGSPAYAFVGNEYGRSVYARTAVALETVGRVWGRRRLIAALGRYARAQRFAHPTPRELYAAFDAELWAGFSRRVLEPALDEGADGAVHVDSLHTRQVQDVWVAEVDARRSGAIPIPTHLQLVDSAGDVHSFRWPSSDRRLQVTHRGPHRIEVARVDPYRHNLLDPVISDNTRYVAEPPEHGGVWTRLLFMAQQLLTAVGP